MPEEETEFDFSDIVDSSVEGDVSEAEFDFSDIVEETPDVKKKGTTAESPSQDGESVSTEIETQEKPSTLNPALLKNSGIYNYINTELIDRGDEKQVARDLQSRYSQYGFDFEPSGIGDAVQVTKNKGTEDEVTEVFDLDPAWYNLTSEEGEAKRMKEWLSENTTSEDLIKYQRNVANTYSVEDTDPQNLQLAQEGDEKQVTGPTGPTGADGVDLETLDREIFPENQELGIELAQSGADGVEGVTGTGIITATMNDALEAEVKANEEKQKSKDAMLLAVGMEEGRAVASVTANITGGLDDAIMPGQETLVAEQAKQIIDNKRKESGVNRFEKGQDNYYANIALNYYDQMMPNKSKRIRDEIENNPTFFEETSALQVKSSNLVQEGLDIAYTVHSNQRDDLMSRNKDLIKEAEKLESSIMDLSQKVVGDKFVGSQEEFDKYVADFNTLKLMYDTPKFREINSAQKSVNAVMQDYQSNSDVLIVSALNNIKEQYQERTDAAYKNSGALYQVMLPLWDGYVQGSLKLTTSLASLANNIITDDKYDWGDVADDYIQNVADTYAVKNPAPTKFARDFYEKSANVDGFEVVLKDGSPTGEVYGSNGYKADDVSSEYVLKKFNSSPESYEEYSNFNVRAGMYSATPVAIDMLMSLIPIGGAVSKGAQALKIGQKTSAMIGTFSAIVVQSQDDFYETARELGATDSEALSFAMAQSAAIGGIALINPVEAKALMATVGSSSRKGLARQYVRNLSKGKGPKESYRLAVEATTSQTLVGGVKTVVKEGLKEGGEETLEIPGGEIVSNVFEYAGGIDATSEMDSQEAINTFALAFMGSLPFAMLGLKGRGSYAKEMLYAAVNDIDGTRSFLEESKGKTVKGPGGITRRIDEEYIEEHIAQLEELKRSTETFFNNPDITDADKESITNLVSHRRALEKQLKEGGLTPSVEMAYKETMSKIDMNLNQYVNKKEGEPFYILEGKAVSKEFLQEQMQDPKWVEGFKSGRWNLSIQNDSDIMSELSELYDGKKEDAVSQSKKIEVTNEEVIAELTIRGLAATKENQKQVRFELEQEKKEVAPAEEAVVEEAALVEEKERGFFGKILDKVFKKEKIDEDVQLTEEQKEQGIQDVYDEQIKYLESNIEEYQKEGNSVSEDRYKRDLEELKSKSPTQYLERDLEIQKEMPQRYSDAAKKGEYPSLYNKEYVSKSVDRIYQTEKLLGITATEQEVKARQDIIDSTPTQAELEAQQETVPAETKEAAPTEEFVAPSEQITQKRQEDREEDAGEVSEQREGEAEGETDSVLQEEVAPDTQESLDQKKSDLTTSKARGKQFKRDAINRVKKAIKALSKIAPDVKFVVHTDVDSYAAVNSGFDKNREDNGFFSSASNTIHINLDSINDLDGLKTIGHEVFHAVLYNRLGLETGRTYFSVETKRMLDAVMGAAKISKKLKKELDGVIGDMDLDEDLELSEETLAELAGILSANYESLQLTTKKAIMKWVNDLAKKLNISKEIFKGVNTEAELIDMLNVLSGKVAEGEVITEEDVVAVESVRVSEEEVGESGATGKVNIKRRARGIKAPSVKEDPRPFARLIQDIDLREFSGMDFITNMYDYTTAGKVDLGGGFTIDLFGGKDYVPFMMEKQGLKLGDKSNLAAFNSQDNAEGFIRNAMNSGAKLFMPHSGTLDASWQFQHAIFEQVSNFALDNNILSNQDIIDLFNKTLKSKDGRDNFKNFKENYAKQTGEQFTGSNFDQFLDNSKELIELLDADKNYSPDLRKDVSNKIISVKKFQKALGIKNKQQFFDMIISPLNKGVKGGEIMGAVDFDPSTFEVKKTKPGDVDHHPSFGYTLLAKINGIYQPTEFYQSNELTDSYIKYNKEETIVSKKEEAATREEYKEALKDTRVYRTNKKGKQVIAKGKAPFVGTFKDFKEKKFKQSNVSSSAGAIPKVAKIGKDKFRRRKPKEGKEKVTVYRGKGKNYKDTENEGFDWVSEDKAVADEYAGKDESGKLTVEEREIDKPKNVFSLPYKNPNQYVTSENIANLFRRAMTNKIKSKELTKEQWKSISEKIKQYEKLAGKKLEMTHTKLNKPEVAKIAAEILSDLGYDAIGMKEDGKLTYGIIKKPTKAEEEKGRKFRRKKKASDVVTNQSVNDDIKAEQKETSRYRKFRRKVRSFIQAFADYQYPIKDALKKAGLESAVTRLINVKGASAFAKFKFDQVRDQIFGNLTIDERIQLDRYIAARRAVVANEERQRRIQQAEVDLINGDITSKEYDKILEQEQNGNPILTEGLTPEEMMEDMVKLENEFPHFVKRADKYFEVFQSQLDEDLKNGLIPEELYNSLTGLDYSPRVFLKYIYNIDGILDGDENWENKLKSDYGMSADNIRRLKEGIASSGSKVDGYLIELMKDSEVLLANYLNARAKKNMMNEATKKLAEGLPETFERLQELKDKKDTGVKLSKSEEVELNSLETVARTFSETKNSKKGLTSELIYYIDGKKQSIYTTGEVRSQWFDNKPNQMDGAIKKWLSSTTGSNLLKKMATGLNPLFVVTNAPRDYFQVLAFTDTYSKTRLAGFVPFRMVYLLKDFVKAWKSIHTKDKNFEQAVEDGLMLDFLFQEGRDEQPIKTVAKQAVDAVASGKPKDIGQKKVLEKIFEKALYFNEVSEVGFRMAIRDRVMKEEMRKLDKRYPDVGSLSPEEKAKYDAEVADIRALATSKAREYMDFSTGGSITKALDPALPYLNAAAVGAFASTKYMKENPGKFALDLIQIAGGSVGVIAGSSVAAIAMFRPDDDEDELNKLANKKFSKNYEDLTDAQKKEIKPSALDIYIDQKRKIPSYVSDRYFVIFTGKIDKNGGYQYIKVAKNQGLAPFLSLTEDLTMNALREYQGESKVYSNTDIFLNANRNLWNNYNAFGFNPVDVFTGDEPLKEMYKIPAEIVARNPFIGGSIEIATNYDFFRGKPINYGATKGSLPKYRGYKDDSLEGFYIDIARSTGLGAGKDIKYAVEKILTSPSTNPGMAIVYGIGENLSITSNTFDKTEKRGMSRITDQVGKRFLGYTNPNYEPNMIEREKKIQEYIKKTTGDEVGRNEMISAYAETVSEVLIQDDGFIKLVNDPDMTGDQKKVFIDGALDNLIDTDPSLKTYLKTVGLKELSDDDRKLLETQIDKNFTIGEIKGANVYKFRQAIRKSSDSRQLARNFLMVSQGMSPDDPSFKELEREFKDYYTKLRADVKTSKLAKNLPSDFNRLYKEEYKAFERDQQQ